MMNKNNIYTSITESISISVIPAYETQESNPAIGQFVYSYQVTIENLGLLAVKLISRHWFIVDSIQVKREVKGEGVIGQQPIIEPGESFQYMSWCPLNSPIGKMYGSYLMQKIKTKEMITVTIPEFILVSDFKLN